MASYAVVWHEKGRVRVLWGCWTQNGESFTHDQWLAERARLQNKPSWEDAPEWAKWLAQASGGHWECFEEEPRLAKNYWNHKPSRGECVDFSKYKGEVLGDWRETLEPRPEERTMTKKEWRGPEDGLPPEYRRCMCKYITDAYDIEFECTVQAYSKGMVWFTDHTNNSDREFVYDLSHLEFRPLRTEEDLAVEGMYRDATGDDLCGDEMDDQDVVSLCQIMYKAGYRKQEPSE